MKRRQQPPPGYRPRFPGTMKLCSPANTAPEKRRKVLPTTKSSRKQQMDELSMFTRKELADMAISAVPPRSLL